MADSMKPHTDAWYARQRRWKHNGFFGHVSMLKANMRAILQSDSTSAEAKQIAVRIEHDAHLLGDALKQRVDP